MVVHIGFYVCNDNGKNANDISSDVKNLVNLENKKGYNHIETFKKILNTNNESKKRFNGLIN